MKSTGTVELTKKEFELVELLNKIRPKASGKLLFLKSLCTDAFHINMCFFKGKEYTNRRIIAHYPFSNRIVFSRNMIPGEFLEGKNEVSVIANKLKEDEKFLDALKDHKIGYIGVSIIHPKDQSSYFTVMLQENNNEKIEEAYATCIDAIDDKEQPTAENIMGIINKFRYVLKLHELDFVDEVNETSKSLSSRYTKDAKVLDEFVDLANEHDGNFVFIEDKEKMGIRNVINKLFENDDFLNLCISSAHGFGASCIPGVGYFLMTTYSIPSDIGITDNDVVDNVVQINPWNFVKDKKMTPRLTKTPKAQKQKTEAPQRPTTKDPKMATPIKAPKKQQQQPEKKIEVKETPKKAEPKNAYVWRAKDDDVETQVFNKCWNRKMGTQFKKFDDEDINKLREETKRIAVSGAKADKERIVNIVKPIYDNIYVTSFSIKKSTGPEALGRDAHENSMKDLAFNPYIVGSEITHFSLTMSETEDDYFFLAVFAVFSKELNDSHQLIAKLNKFRIDNHCPPFNLYPELSSFASQGLKLMIDKKELLPMCKSQKDVLIKDGAISCDSTVMHVVLPRTGYIDVLAKKIIEKDSEKILSNFDTIGACFKLDGINAGKFYVGVYYERRYK